jgi:hypothetical protein
VLMAILTVMAVIAQSPSTVAAETGGAGQVEQQPPVGSTPFDRQGMWIWYVDRSEGGSVAAIVARAKHSGIGTVYVKSGDGASFWDQFNRPLVAALHAGGLDVCAWQFVYGDSPVAEAKAGALAVVRGADCLVIDAEGDYEGKYASADRYIRTLRAAIGDGYPLSLAAFPYVDYHPSFPYSVFLGPGGATYNQPQMYWRSIQTSVRAVYEHTYLYNRLWGHPIYPIGQTYEGPSVADLKSFRRFAASFGGLAPSWWSWQETSGREWGALAAASADRPVTGYRPAASHPLLRRGSRGDLVVWAQERLIGAGLAAVPVTGVFGRATYSAVRSFQASQGLPVDGKVGTGTWESLMRFTPFRMRWAGGTVTEGAGGGASTADAGRGGASTAATTRGGASMTSAASPGGTVTRVLAPSRPLSASLPAKGYEIRPGPAP